MYINVWFFHDAYSYIKQYISVNIVMYVISSGNVSIILCWIDDIDIYKCNVYDSRHK
jgi:methionine salvage enolase-phosphatase E1